MKNKQRRRDIFDKMICMILHKEEGVACFMHLMKRISDSVSAM